MAIVGFVIAYASPLMFGMLFVSSMCAQFPKSLFAVLLCKDVKNGGEKNGGLLISAAVYRQTVGIFQLVSARYETDAGCFTFHKISGRVGLAMVLQVPETASFGSRVVRSSSFDFHSRLFLLSWEHGLNFLGSCARLAMGLLLRDISARQQEMVQTYPRTDTLF
jgi:hypothetical protein